jgi:hypothetical protein
MSLVRKVDDKDFDCIEKRNTDEWLNSGEYFDKVRDVVDENNEIIQNWLSLL